MGKLSIRGTAEREVSYDSVEISVEFCVRSKTTKESLNSVMEQCERCLELLTKAGMDIKHISINDDSVEQVYEDGEIYIRAARKIDLHFAFDMVFANYLLDLIKSQNFDVAIQSNYQLRDTKELHEELLKEALADSRRKAEFIAESMGQKVIGIETVNYKTYFNEHCRLAERSISCLAGGGLPFSDQIGAPTTTEEESIDVEWLIG